MTYDDLSDDEKARMLACYEAGFAAGSGRPWLIDDPEHIEFVIAVANVYWTGMEAMRAIWKVDNPALAPEQIPEWLRALSERETALSDARPPEGRSFARTASEPPPER